MGLLRVPTLSVGHRYNTVQPNTAQETITQVVSGVVRVLCWLSFSGWSSLHIWRERKWKTWSPGRAAGQSQGPAAGARDPRSCDSGVLWRRAHRDTHR